MTGSRSFSAKPFRTRILPALEEPCGILIIISAGFDAASPDRWRDHLVADELPTGDVANHGEIAGRHSRATGSSVCWKGAFYDLVGLAESAAAHVITSAEG